jgi:hypothetical protein
MSKKSKYYRNKVMLLKNVKKDLYFNTTISPPSFVAVLESGMDKIKNQDPG